MLIGEKQKTKNQNKLNSSSKKLYIQSYGCAMNFSDSEVVASILEKEGYVTTQNSDDANLILINTCSIREKAEQTVRRRIQTFKKKKEKKSNLVIGILGCMAERLKSKFLEEEKLVDLVIGPDAYRDLPKLLKETEEGRKAVNVILSKEETYADINPVRLNSNGVTAFVSIMRGCDNMCSFCVVPFTRGRERSRNPKSILKEVANLNDLGYKEVTLLGQNVDSYLWFGGGAKKDFLKLAGDQSVETTDFSNLLDLIAIANPKVRIRFSTSNPQDMKDSVLKTIAKHPNICNYIHLPVQSGSSKVLELMNRGHTREWYLDRIKAINKYIPECGLSSDFITGFCNETEEDHQLTLSLMETVKYNFSYMFHYSERPNTFAQRKLRDNVPEKVKKRRLQEIIDAQQKHSLYRNQLCLGRNYEVLIEGISKKSNTKYFGRTTQNTVVVFEKQNSKIGEFVNVKINNCSSATLIGEII
ncbi:MAG: tRNA (N6-isopentenyl adenosine(37)-C2)-methylthiotransferase MiaB [Flavobacteriales bacterium]|nr:tRNA (N6-isopentenyl adenosine(37)-C2)-methylthiotransferase MiaB [Flavobacteriales bacterium]|tara:strand:- start:6704 stop:8119 length:1416 start_codon:yes stop_codon:yes gene_type:complete